MIESFSDTKPSKSEWMKFEHKVSDQVSTILSDNGPFLLKLKDMKYLVLDVSPCSGSKNKKADITLYTDKGDINLSLKLSNRFAAYSGIVSESRPYFKAIKEHPFTRAYIRSLKEKLEKNKTGDKYDRYGEEFFWNPPFDCNFIKLVAFGDKQYTSDGDYVDYIIKGEEGKDLLKETDKGCYSIIKEARVLNDCTELTEDLTPVFLSRTSNKRHSYDILNTRTQIVSLHEVNCRRNPTPLKVAI